MVFEIGQNSLDVCKVIVENYNEIERLKLV
jgi:hypothetical protein